MFRKIFILLITSLLIANYGFLIKQTFAQEEKITITTYYPSPYGSYNQLYVADKLGIGTTNPSSHLEIDKTDTYATLGLKGTWTTPSDGNPLGELRFRGNDSGGNAQDYAYITGRSADVTDGTEDGQIDFYTHVNGVQNRTMTITSGNVGIGTPNPGELLEVVGTSDPTILIRNPNLNSAQSGKLGFTEYALAEPAMWILYNGLNERLDFGADAAGSKILTLGRTEGNVGIGTYAATNTKLHILGQSPALRIDDVSDPNNPDGTRFMDWDIVATHSGNTGRLDIRRGGGGVNIMSIVESTPGGNVGIGTTDPQEKLSIVSALNQNAVSISTSSTTGAPYGILFANNLSTIRFGMYTDYGNNFRIHRAIAGSGNWKDFMIGSNGFVGLGIEPSLYRLQLPNIAGPAGQGLASSWIQYSSIRWKKNIKPIQGALEKIKQLRGVSYDWKSNGKHDVGLIAEEVGKVIPEAVSYEENGKDTVGLDYNRLIGLLVEAIKEQQEEIEYLKKKIH